MLLWERVRVRVVYLSPNSQGNASGSHHPNRSRRERGFSDLYSPMKGVQEAPLRGGMRGKGPPRLTFYSIGFSHPIQDPTIV
jgi:hypothetical protein